MTPHEISLIQTSFARLFPQKARFGALFYERFFDLVPEARAMFHTSMTRQSDMLVEALALIVRGLRADGALPPKALQLVARHGRYGVRADHYARMGEALLRTLDEVLGDDFDTETMIAATGQTTPDPAAEIRNTC